MVHFIYGEDNFLLKKYLIKFFKSNDFELEEYDFDPNILESIIANSYTRSMFAEKRNIVIKNFNFLNEKKYIKDSNLVKSLTNLLNAKNIDNEIIFIANEPISSRLKLTKLFKEKSKFIETGKVSKSNLSGYVKKIIDANKIDITQEAIDYMLIYIPSDLLAIENELLKFKSLNKKIDLNIIKENLLKQQEGNIFELFNHLISNDPKNFFELYYVLKNNGTDINFILSVLAKNVTLVKHIAILKRQKLSYSEILGTIKINPYQFKILYSSLGNIQISKINQWLKNLYDIDKIIKFNYIKFIELDIHATIMMTKLFV